MWALILVLAVALALELATIPGIIVAAAAAPVLCWTVVVVLLDAAPRAWSAMLAGFLGGAVAAATLAQVANDSLTTWVTVAIGAERARALVPTSGAPLIEEGAKAFVLVLVIVLQRPAFRGPRDGLVWGALVGLGFTLSENLLYALLAAVGGGYEALKQSTLVRGFLAGLTHAVFTATTGVGLGWAAVARAGWGRIAAAAGGFGAATAQHVLWNAVASLLVMRALCGPGFPTAGCQVPPDGPSLLTIALRTATFLGPPIVLLWFLAARAPAAPAPRDA